MTDRIDWKAIIAELESAGITRYKLGLMLQAQINQVNRWASGREPKHSTAIRILGLHAQHCVICQSGMEYAGLIKKVTTAS